MSDPTRVPPNRTAEYRGRDLRCEGSATTEYARYGLVVFNEDGQVLLREPAEHFGGHWFTFSKGQAEAGVHPLDKALRETFGETGHKPDIIGHMQRTFIGGSMNSANNFYLGFDTQGQIDPQAVERDKETWSVRWATCEEAVELIKKTKDGGRERDLETLHAAYEEFQWIMARDG